MKGERVNKTIFFKELNGYIKLLILQLNFIRATGRSSACLPACLPACLACTIKLVLSIEIVVTPRSSLGNEKNEISFWYYWVANQWKNRPLYNITIKIHPLRMG